jgi:hypothetical protein
MKKSILALSLVALLGTASAQAHGPYRMGGWHGGYYHGGCYGCGWVAPALIGGVIGYELARPETVVVEQPQVVYAQPPVVVTPSVVQQPPAGYHWQQITDPATNTQKMALVPN